MPVQCGGERATSGGDRGEGGRGPACAAAAAAAGRATALRCCQVGGAILCAMPGAFFGRVGSGLQALHGALQVLRRVSTYASGCLVHVI